MTWHSRPRLHPTGSAGCWANSRRGPASARQARSSPPSTSKPWWYPAPGRRHRAAATGRATRAAAHLPRPDAGPGRRTRGGPPSSPRPRLHADGVRTEARIITEIVCKDFATAGHLASYSGFAPVTWGSGTSIRGDQSSKKGNKVLKPALFLFAFAALKDPVSRAYYDRKPAEGKRRNQALIALARRRCDVLFAMLRGHELLRNTPAQGSLTS